MNWPVICAALYVIISCFVFCVVFELIPDYKRDDIDLFISFLWPLILVITLIVIICIFIYDFIGLIFHKDENS